MLKFPLTDYKSFINIFIEYFIAAADAVNNNI